MRLIFILLLSFPSLVWANDWAALREPGAIAIMRHALAPGGGDPAHHTIGECTTQRNLSAAGQQQARAIGAALRTENISFDAIYTSQWCRTQDTARLLGMGPATDAPMLNSFFGNRASGPAQTNALRMFLERAQGLNLYVTHQVNISALTGTGTASGEIIVFRLTSAGTEILGRILIDP